MGRGEERGRCAFVMGWQVVVSLTAMGHRRRTQRTLACQQGLGLDRYVAWGKGSKVTPSIKVASIGCEPTHPTPPTPGMLTQTVVDVDEEGTVAAAVTGIMLTRSVAPQPEPPVELTFDRPFLFIIRHVPSGVPVFVGAVRAPPVAR